MLKSTPIKRIFQTTTVDEIINAWPPEIEEPWYWMFGEGAGPIYDAMCLDDEMQDAAKKGDCESWWSLADERQALLAGFREECQDKDCIISWKAGTLWRDRRIEKSMFWKWVGEDE